MESKRDEAANRPLEKSRKSESEAEELAEWAAIGSVANTCEASSTCPPGLLSDSVWSKVPQGPTLPFWILIFRRVHTCGQCGQFFELWASEPICFVWIELKRDGMCQLFLAKSSNGLSLLPCKHVWVPTGDARRSILCGRSPSENTTPDRSGETVSTSFFRKRFDEKL